MAAWNVMVVGRARFTASCCASTRCWISAPRRRARSDFASCSARVLWLQVVALAASRSACARSSRACATSAGEKEKGLDGTAYIRSMLLMWFSVSRCRSPDGQRAHHFTKCLGGVLADVDLPVVRLVAVDGVPGLGHLPVPLVPLVQRAKRPAAQAPTALRRHAVMRVWVLPRHLRSVSRNLRLLATGGRR